MARILIVEDEAPNVEILTRLMKRSGHETLVARSRDAAIAAARDSAPELILMDIGLPPSDGSDEIDIMAGLQATKWIKANAATACVPIIATSASAMPDDIKRFREAGCDDVVSKPYDFPVLLETIQRQLGAGKG